MCPGSGVWDGVVRCVAERGTVTIGYVPDKDPEQPHGAWSMKKTFSPLPLSGQMASFTQRYHDRTSDESTKCNPTHLAIPFIFLADQHLTSCVFAVKVSKQVPPPSLAAYTGSSGCACSCAVASIKDQRDSSREIDAFPMSVLDDNDSQYSDTVGLYQRTE